MRTVYRTGYRDFGNHLEQRQTKTNRTHSTIIFFLTIGGRGNLRQIKRLIRTIYSRQHYYLIHVDSVCQTILPFVFYVCKYACFVVVEQRDVYLYNQLLELSAAFVNIELTRKRYPTTWGASTLLDAHLDAFKQIFDELKWNFSFIINLSESDFPLK
jgi:protein xylosyltransferase